MRILIISKFFPPENSIASLRPYSWAKYWAMAGHEIEVVTVKKNHDRPEAMVMPFTGFEVHEVDYPPFYYRCKEFFQKVFPPVPKSGEHGSVMLPTNGTASGKKGGKYAFLKEAGRKVNDYRIKKGLLMSIRMPDNLDFWISQALAWAQSQPPWDLVVSTHGPYATHIIGYRLKMKGQARRWVADFRDLWTDNHIYEGVYPFIWFEKFLEYKMMKEADQISTVSGPLADALARKHGYGKVFVVENGFESDLLQDLSPEPAFPRDGKKRIIYAGTIYQGRRDPIPLFQAIATLAAQFGSRKALEKLEVIFLGSNAEVLKELIVQYRVGEWIKLGGFLPRIEVLRMQRDADVLLFLESEKGKKEGILTGKLFEYLASGTQIWGVGVDAGSSPGDLIEKAHAGILFGTDSTKIYEELVLLLQEQDKRPVKTNSNFLKRFDREELALQMLQKIIKG
jgi:glycosyltransferase involved in cell wall biosynthesis